MTSGIDTFVHPPYFPEGNWSIPSMASLNIPPDDGTVKLVQLHATDQRYKNVEDLV